MHIVTDSGTDVSLSPAELQDLNIHIIPLKVELAGTTYREGLDIEPEEFYKRLEATDALPVTSQPSAGDFAEVYRKIAEQGEEILSIHISSGLSGTLNSAITGAKMVPEAKVTHIDTKTLSAAAGWQVEAAARAVKAGWPLEKIFGLAASIGATSESLYTLSELKYLIHGGRISHMKGLIASMLNLKPMIGVEKENGTYEQRGQARTFKRALSGLVDLMTGYYKEGSALRVQVLHAFNPEGAQMLREQIEKRFQCTWLPMGPMSLVLGAHTGPSMVGVAFGRLEIFEQIP